MALDHCAELIVKMHDPRSNHLDIHAANYFDTSFMEHFRQLEKQIHNNWRLHKAYYDAQGELCQITDDRSEALEIVKQMVSTLKSRTCSLPVKKSICEKLAQIVSNRPNYQVRDLIHKTMMQVFAISRTSQQRQVFLTFLECLLPRISSMHFNQVYEAIFLEFREESVQQVMVQWIKLFPLVRLRVTEQRLIDRLDLLLRNLHTKFGKIPKTSLVTQTIEDIIGTLRSPEFQQECRDFMANQNNEIMQKEMQISEQEYEERPQGNSVRQNGARSQLKSNNKFSGASMLGMLHPHSAAPSKRPNSQR